MNQLVSCIQHAGQSGTGPVWSQAKVGWVLSLQGCPVWEAEMVISSTQAIMK